MTTTPNLDKKMTNNRRRPTKAEVAVRNQASWSFDPNANKERPDLSNRFPKVAVYKRISMLVDESVTFERQYREVMQFLKNSYGLDPELGNCTITVFEEEGSAYKNKKRPKFDAMIDAIAAGEYTHLAAYELERLFRNVNVSGRVTPVLARSGISICVKQFGAKIDLGTFEGQMMWQMFALMAEKSSKDTSDRQLGSVSVRAGHGIKTGGYDPFGLRTVKKQVDGLGGMRSVFEIDDDPQPDFPDNWSKADTVREIFSRYTSGHSISSIVKWLNKAGFPCAQGGDFWTQGHIRRMLTSPAYMGGSHHKNVVTLNSDGSYKITHEQLISVEAWDKVQVLVASRKIKKQERPKASQLSGLLRCADCSHTLLSCNAKTHGKPLRLFRCNTPLLGGKCAGNQVAAIGLEESIFDITYAIVSKPELYSLVSSKSNGVEVKVQSSEETALLEELAAVESDLAAVRSAKAKADLEQSIATIKAQIALIHAKQASLLTLAKHTSIGAPELFKQAWENEDRVKAQIYMQSIFKHIVIAKSEQKHNHHYYKKLGWKMDIDRVTLVFHDGSQISLRMLCEQGPQVLLEAAA